MEPEAVRAYFAIHPGSCWNYKTGDTIQATASVSGPDTASVLERTLYRREFRLLSGRSQVHQLDVNSQSGALQMVRRMEMDEGQNDYRYEAVAAPIWAEFESIDGEPSIRGDGRFETTTVPNLCANGGCSDGPEETHRFTVLGSEEPITLPSGDEAVGTLFQHQVNDARSEEYLVVPGFGIARYRTNKNAVYQACGAYVCDADGENCVGSGSMEGVTDGNCTLNPCS